MKGKDGKRQQTKFAGINLVLTNASELNVNYCQISSENRIPLNTNTLILKERNSFERNFLFKKKETKKLNNYIKNFRKKESFIICFILSRTRVSNKNSYL